MALFMIERKYAEQIDVGEAEAASINMINDEEGVKWLYSFLSRDKRRTYCLYEAPSADAIVSAAQRSGLPADVVVELDGRVMPDGSPSSIPI